MGERPVSVGRDAAATFVAGMQPVMPNDFMLDFLAEKKHVAMFMWKTMLKIWEKMGDIHVSLLLSGCMAFASFSCFFYCICCRFVVDTQPGESSLEYATT